VLCDPGLAATVFDHLLPRDVRGLRASCKGAAAAVAGHAWESAAAPAAWAGSPHEASLWSLRDRILAAGGDFDWFGGLRRSSPPLGGRRLWRARCAGAFAGLLPPRARRGHERLP
jgi:hypothetical protein